VILVYLVVQAKYDEYLNKSNENLVIKVWGCVCCHELVSKVKVCSLDEKLSLFMLL